VAYKLTIEEMQELALQKGGECLSESYINVNTELKWQCQRGHRWDSPPNDIKRGKWCPYCFRKRRVFPEKLTIEEMQELALQKGGECLSESYIGSKVKLKWQCKEGHVWESLPTTVKKGCWCRFCAIQKRKLNIEEMMATAEARGGQCLSEIYVDTYTKLKWQCSQGHVWKAKPNHIRNGKWCPYCSGSMKLTIEDMFELAKERGGECLSENYVNINRKLRWRCEKGHVWETTAGCIKKGRWCPYCSHKMKLTLDDMNELADARGGECLSKKYLGSTAKLKWKCKTGHVWETTPSIIMNGGSWCYPCLKIHRRKALLDKIKDLSKSMGGQCLSDEYVNNYSKLKWECKEEHVWEATFTYVRDRGYFCVECRKQQRRMITTMSKLQTPVLEKMDAVTV